ncbi:trk system potassium uptake protein TrkA [Clostridium tetanomorphum]|uniref:TrkA family potassium uptake protein n=1 Tax=Clostridium tetanomorphum TaxID=1553 RepID=A0A923E8U9_CLOTT|nr:TrkA family potassium uptake protein [Clostridium tetanomorphum]KAJ53740.1 TrkA-N domain-containing protein [Clostridium tetanomorphum DSM 665]MBC2397251.1 TrkA family potassium uptake protein [Clostridium tetanomorphum]MBP1862468.1 trk system potassium uptake protein TrkA [Clostridium tetanomorphum]NRS85692.1 trk system potassium uptake protein TrkA [Clostridium tetanomorphum]NRZ96298.1 trk system potassium uptake protein TrkA [Clostridium tetanomorphum]
MNILIVGGWKKADFLLNSLLSKKHKVTVIHDNYEYCKILSRKYDAPIICGDGSKQYILEEAKIYNADIIIAMTPKDADNLVICQLAKNVYGIKRTFATVANPKNVEVFKKLGVDTVVSATYIMAGIIEQIATVEEISNFIPLEGGKIVLMEIIIKSEYPICNKSITEIKFPEKAIIGFIIRGVNSIIPKGKTKILKNDKLIVLSPPNVQKEVIKLVVGSNGL